MKRIGIVGGIGPESTSDYYKKIITAIRLRESQFNYPEIVILSANLAELLELFEAEQWQKVTDWLLEKIKDLHNAGAEFAAIAAGTPHMVFNEVEKKSPIPLLSIVEETCKKAKNFGLKKIGLMATKFTMQSDFFLIPFHENKMSVVVPQKNDQEFIHNKIVTELESNIIKESTRDAFLCIIKRMIEKEHIDSLILGCTELPLILDKDEYGIRFLNTTDIHVESIVNYCLDREK